MSFTTVLLGIVLIIVLYLAIGYFFHFVIFPETKPDPENYFEPGDSFGSDEVGDEITVVDRDGDDLIVEIRFGPHAEGPPLHIQTEWDETFRATSGTLGLVVDGKQKRLEPGDEFTVRRGVPHKPYNPTDQPAVCEANMPAQFVVYLSQVYGYMDEDEKNAEPPRMIFQMALFNQYFDSYLGEGPPVFIQKVLNFFLIPIARLMGYKSFYERYRI